MLSRINRLMPHQPPQPFHPTYPRPIPIHPTPTRLRIPPLPLLPLHKPKPNPPILIKLIKRLHLRRRRMQRQHQLDIFHGAGFIQRAELDGFLQRELVRRFGGEGVQGGCRVWVGEFVEEGEEGGGVFG